MARDYSGVKLEPWYRKRKGGRVWWTAPEGSLGEHLFSFDKKKIFNLFADYPNELTPEEKALFDKEETYWAGFFAEREYNPKNAENSADVPKGVIAMAKEFKYNGVKYIGDWNGYKVYDEKEEPEEETVSGVPTLILYDEKSKKTRVCTSDEYYEIAEKLLADDGD